LPGEEAEQKKGGKKKKEKVRIMAH